MSEMNPDQVRYIATGGNHAGEFTKLERELAQYVLNARQALQTMCDFGTKEWCEMIIGARDLRDKAAPEAK